MLSPALSALAALAAPHLSLVVLLVKATIILVAALGTTMAMQRASAGARHLVWLVTLGTLLIMPALTAWGPLPVRMLPAESLVAAPANPTSGPTPRSATDTRPRSAFPGRRRSCCRST